MEKEIGGCSLSNPEGWPIPIRFVNLCLRIKVLISWMFPSGPNGFLMAQSARLSYVASEKDRNALQMFEATQLQLESTHTSKALAAQITALQSTVEQ